MTSDFQELDDTVAELSVDDLTDRTPEDLYDEPEQEVDDDLSSVEFDGDTGTLTAEVRSALVAILNERFITSDTHKKEWQTLTVAHAQVKSRLNDMYLDLEYDAKYEVAFKVQVRNADSTRGFPALLRAMTWNRDQTAVLVHLCLTHRDQTSSGASRAVVSRSDIHAFIGGNRPKTATDQYMDGRRVNNAIEAVAAAGLLDKTAEDGVYTISPALPRLLPLTRLRELVTYFTEASNDE